MIVVLDRLWLTPVTDPSLSYGFRLAADGLESDPQVTATMDPLAGGRVRLMVTPSQKQQMPVTLRLDTRHDVNALTSWQATLLCVRDPKGRKFFAAYTDLKITERAFVDSATATLTLNEVTYDEAV